MLNAGLRQVTFNHHCMYDEVYHIRVVDNNYQGSHSSISISSKMHYLNCIVQTVALVKSLFPLLLILTIDVFPKAVF